MSTASASTATVSPTSPPVRAPANEAPPAHATADAVTDATTSESAADDDAITSAANDADLELVMAQCGVPMETACELLNQANGDIVEAIAYHLNPELAASEAHKEAQEWALVGKDEGEDARQAREVQAKLAELRDITTAKNAMLDAQMRARKAAAAEERGC